LRLSEILIWASTNRPLPSRGVSGGEWILVFFLCFFGFTLYAVKGFSRWWPGDHVRFNGLDMFGESFSYPLSAEKQSSKTPRIVGARDFRSQGCFHRSPREKWRFRRYRRQRHGRNYLR